MQVNEAILKKFPKVMFRLHYKGYEENSGRIERLDVVSVEAKRGGGIVVTTFTRKEGELTEPELHYFASDTRGYRSSPKLYLTWAAARAALVKSERKSVKDALDGLKSQTKKLAFAKKELARVQKMRQPK